jgi:hypothetical protein
MRLPTIRSLEEEEEVRQLNSELQKERQRNDHFERISKPTREPFVALEI